jgi:hypothetical protein
MNALFAVLVAPAIGAAACAAVWVSRARLPVAQCNFCRIVMNQKVCLDVAVCFGTGKSLLGRALSGATP